MIYCIGDSFTFGDELPGTDYINRKASNLAWPSVLSQKLNHPITNLGRGGCGNTRIIKRAIDCTLTLTKDPIIIAWTSPLRIELADEGGLFDVWPARNTIYMESSRNNIVTEITKIHNDNTNHWAYRQWLRDVILLQSFFKQYNQPYLMVQSHITQMMYWEFKDLDLELKDQVDKDNFLGWPSEGMVEWAVNTKRGPGHHFLEEGHRIVADKIYEHIRHLGWIS